MITLRLQYTVLMMLMASILFGQHKVSHDCSRLAYPEQHIDLANLLVGEIHTLTFGHNPDLDKHYPFSQKRMLKMLVSKITFSALYH